MSFVPFLSEENPNAPAIPEFPQALVLMFLIVPLMAGTLYCRKKLLKKQN